MKGIASQQRRVAKPKAMPVTQIVAGQAAQRVQAASAESVSAASEGDLTTEINTLKTRLDNANIP